MAGRLCIDEKGTQESFRISDPFNHKDKIAYGTDKMNSYVACAVYINENEYPELVNFFLKLEKKYLAKTQNQNRELKSDKIFKKKFTHGIHSMRDKDVAFYEELFTLLINRKCSLLTYSISKMSVLVNAKLLEWFYVLDEKSLVKNIFSFKYILTKYLNNEASKKVIEALLEIDLSPITFLNEVQRDMKQMIKNIKRYPKMKRQADAYSEIINIIVKYKHFANHKPSNAVFDWGQVSSSIDLWQTERSYFHNENINEIDLFLDQGIPYEKFESLKFGRINSDCDSKDTPGIRIADLLVGFFGNFLKGINKIVKSEETKYEETQYLEKLWFELDEARFNLLKLSDIIFLEMDNIPFYLIHFLIKNYQLNRL